MRYIYYHEERHVINAAIERPQARNCERIATRFGIDTERMGDFNEQSGRKTGSSKIAVIQISQFLSTSVMHIGNIVI